MAHGDPIRMSIFSAPFDPARDAALVTGAGNGIGRAIAQALVGEGVRTVFADLNGETVSDAVKASPRPELAVTWVGDLASRAACNALLADAETAVGQVTHFVHSASPPRREADHALAVSEEIWARMHAVNLDAGFHLARELARKLMATRTPGLVLDAHLAARRHAAQPAALQHGEGRARHAGPGIGQDARAIRHPGQCAGARRHRGRRVRRRPGAGEAHSARPSWPQRRPRADGPGGAVEPDLGLCDRRGHRGRWRLVAHQLVRPTGARGHVRGRFFGGYVRARENRDRLSGTVCRNLSTFPTNFRAQNSRADSAEDRDSKGYRYGIF